MVSVIQVRIVLNVCVVGVMVPVEVSMAMLRMTCRPQSIAFVCSVIRGLRFVHFAVFSVVLRCLVWTSSHHLSRLLNMSGRRIPKES